MGYTKNPIKATINGQTFTLSEWADFTGLKRTLLWNRYRKGKRGEDLIAPADQRYNPTKRKMHGVWDRTRVTNRLALEKLKNAE